MGQTGSYTAKASAGPLFRLFTTWGPTRLFALVQRSEKDFSDNFALKKKEVQNILSSMRISNSYIFMA